MKLFGIKNFTLFGFFSVFQLPTDIFWRRFLIPNFTATVAVSSFWLSCHQVTLCVMQKISLCNYLCDVGWLCEGLSAYPQVFVWHDGRYSFSSGSTSDFVKQNLKNLRQQSLNKSPKHQYFLTLSFYQFINVKNQERVFLSSYSAFENQTKHS